MCARFTPLIHLYMMRGGPIVLLSAVATLCVLFYISRVESFMSIRSNLRPTIGSGSQLSSSDIFHEEVDIHTSELETQRRLVVVHDAEGLRASLLKERLEQASSWDIVLECRNPILISTPLIIPKLSDIRISSPYWSNPPVIMGRDRTRIFKLEPDSSLELANVQVSGGEAEDGGGFYIDGGKLTLSNCMLTNHTAHERGGGIFSRNGEVNLENTTFNGCSAGDAGGGIYVSSTLPKVHGRKLVSFSRVSFEVNDAPNGADFILGDGSDFAHKILASPLVHLAVAALIG